MAGKKIKFDVLSLVKNLDLSSFSINQLNTAYLKMPACPHTNAKTSKQYLYRSIKCLVNSGSLRSLKRSGSNVIEYQLTSQDIPDSKHSNGEEESRTTSDIEICNMLREKLKHSKLSLLTSIGETEAYKECVESMPAIQDKVQSKYNIARDNTSKLLGKVNAYETLIKLYASKHINE
ncbi:MAG: hypothetical protein WA981_15350 [Glaciecola sp.]